MQVFDYEDIQLIPNKCVVDSRSECDTSVKFGPKTFKIPVVPANMQTIVDESLSEKLAANGYFYVMHRFEPETRIDFIKNMNKKNLFTSISVGIKKDEFDFIDQVVAENLKPDYITIDVAHGHSDRVIEMIKYIKQNLPSSFLIAGNVSVLDLVKCASQNSRPVLVLVVGNWPLSDSVPKLLANQSSLTVV